MTTNVMGDNVSVESMDVIKQYIGFINASTGFKISLEDNSNEKGFLMRIWEAIKKFFANIWNFITGLFSKKKKEEIAAKKIEAAEFLSLLETELKENKIKSVSFTRKNVPAIISKMLNEKKFSDINSKIHRFPQCINEIVVELSSKTSGLDDLSEIANDGRKKFESYKTTDIEHLKEQVNEIETDKKEMLEHIDKETNGLLAELVDGNKELNLGFTFSIDNHMLRMDNSAESPRSDVTIDSLTEEDIKHLKDIYSNYYTSLGIIASGIVHFENTVKTLEGKINTAMQVLTSHIDLESIADRERKEIVTKLYHNAINGLNLMTKININNVVISFKMMHCAIKHLEDFIKFDDSNFHKHN